MATSSIFANFRLTEPKQVEAFVNALEASSRDPERKPSAPVKPPMTDIGEIRKLMAKRTQIN